MLFTQVLQIYLMPVLFGKDGDRSDGIVKSLLFFRLDPLD